jgi:hypothetical protein
MEKNKKLQKKEYENLKSLVSSARELQMRIGSLESVKHEALHELSTIQSDLQLSQKDLREKYGNITVDMETGEYKENKEEE